MHESCLGPDEYDDYTVLGIKITLRVTLLPSCPPNVDAQGFVT